jgi:hypothetical protein
MLDTILEDTKGNKKYIGDIVNTKVEFLFIFSNQGQLGSMVGRMLENIRKDKIICL